MEIQNYGAIVEGILFSWGDPLEIKEIAKVLQVSLKDTKKLIQELQEDYSKNDRGIELLIISDTVQLASKKEVYPFLKKILPKEHKRSLSKATLETLAIITYKQPITKNQIEKIRGVKCDKPLANLLHENLIYEKGRLNSIGRPIIYGTTDYFLKKFGYETLKDLPDINEFDKDLNNKEHFLSQSQYE